MWKGIQRIPGRLIAMLVMLVLICNCFSPCSAIGEGAREYAGHILVSDRDEGACKRLIGEIPVMVVYVNVGDEQWDEAEISIFAERIQAAFDVLIAESAPYGIFLQFSMHSFEGYANEQPGVTGKSREWMEQVLEGIPMLREYGDLRGWQNIPLVLVAPDDGRAFSQQAEEDGKKEFAVLFQTDDAGTVRHELLHLFGAEDYYVHSDVKAATNKIYPDSIMLASDEDHSVDDLTAYVIGWTEELTASACELLDTTAHISSEDISQARTQNQIDGYATVEMSNGAYFGKLKDGYRHGWGEMRYDDGCVLLGHYEWDSRTLGHMTWPDGDSYSGQFAGGTRTGWGVYTWPSGNEFTGYFVHDDCTGKGIYRRNDGDEYIGEFLNNVRTGKGIYCWAEGDMYIGDFADGARTGTGMYIDRDGGIKIGEYSSNQLIHEWDADAKAACGYGTAVIGGNPYTGMLADGVPHGWGKLAYADGAAFVGYWEAGKRIYGMLRFASRSVYQGEFDDNVRSGWGLYIWADGDRYAGGFTENELNGRGIFIWDNANTYIGDYVNGSRTGQGVYSWPSGDIYTGDFSEGYRTGRGYYRWPSGNTHQGDYVKNTMHGTGVFTWADGDVYMGDFVEGSRTGKGTFIGASGDTYTGDFVEGSRTGKGTYLYADGDIYMGDFVNGKRTGQGVYYDVNGSVQQGTFLDNVFID